MSEYLQQEQIESGIKVIEKLLKNITKANSEKSLKELKESVKLLKKKAKMLSKDDTLALEYADRTAFDTIQGVFQALHLFIISSDEDQPIWDAIDWLRGHESCYTIADRMMAKANARADFAAGGKK